MSDKDLNRWSLIVLRGPRKRVRQFRFGRRWVVVLPTLLLAAFAALIIMLQERAAWRIADLERRLAERIALHQADLEARDARIRLLEDEIRKLSVHREHFRAQLDDLHILEQKLRAYERCCGGPDKSDSPGWDVHVTVTDMIRRLDGDEPDFPAIQGMIADMEQAADELLEEARERKREADALPSAWPTRSFSITSGYGNRRDPFTGRTTFHAGIDIAGKTGDPVFAAGDGTVDETGSDPTRGRYIVIAHRNKLRSLYLHLQDIEVEAGDEVKRGTRIGTLGSSGRSTGPHLHFGIERDGESVNPLDYLELVKED